MLYKLLKLYHDELESDELQELPRDMIESIRSYLSSIEEKGGALQSRVAGVELELAKKIIFELYSFRLCKSAMLFSQGRLSMEKLLFYADELARVKAILAQPKEMEEKKEEKEEREEAEHMELLRIIAPLNDTIAVNEQFIYGPFEKDDVVNVPHYLAEVLVRRGIAKPLSEGELDEGSF